MGESRFKNIADDDLQGIMEKAKSKQNIVFAFFFE
jgi:hypothetical protein